MRKQEIDAMIDNGITAKIHEQLGVWSCDFYPFMPQHLMTNDDGEPDIERLEKEQYSTVYRKIRFYFDTPEQLEVFCMAVEQKDVK